jgi:hypothetical protein
MEQWFGIACEVFVFTVFGVGYFYCKGKANPY